MEPTSTSTGSNTGRTPSPPRSLFLRSAASPVGDLRAVQLEAGQLLGVPVMTTERRPLRMDSTGGQNRAHVGGEIVEQCRDTFRIGVGDRDHRRPVAEGHDPATAGHQVPAAPMSWASASNCASQRRRPGNASTASTPWE